MPAPQLPVLVLLRPVGRALMWAGCAALLCAACNLHGQVAAPPGVSSEPFSPRSKPSGTTLFTTLPPEQTGISAINAYDDPKMWREKYREFSLGAIGTGVAIGDFDGDRRPDLFVVHKTGPNHLYRNTGGFVFEDVTEKAGVAGPVDAWKQGAAFADINNDGLLDLYVCRWSAPNLLYVNQGNGTFREEAQGRGLALQDASGMAAFCDYDRDGWLDVYVQTNLLDGESRPNGQRDHLYRNNRDGTFTDVTETAGIRGESQGHSATWWDYNEDGWPDLYVANDFKDPDQLYRNERNGTFTNVLSWVVPHTPHSSMGADAADLNNDGHIDLVVADMAATTRYKDHRGMAKLRTGLTENEQRPDAAPQYMRNAVFLNMGGGAVLEGAFLTGLAATDWTWAVRLEDFDNDGRVDAYFTNGMVRELHNTDLVQRMTAKESMGDRIRIMKAAPPLAERHLAYRNRGDLKFEEVGAAWGLDHVGVGFGAATGDLDGDGDLDLVFASMDGALTVCRNEAATGHALTFSLHGRASNRFGIGAKLRLETPRGVQVRTLVSARGYLSTSEPLVHFGLGDEVAVSRLTVEWPSGKVQIFGPLPADNHYTIVEPDESQRPQLQQKANPQFLEMAEKAHLNAPNRQRSLYELSKEPLLPLKFDRPGPGVLVAKLDADSEDDVVIGGVAGEAGQLFSNLGGGQFMGYGSRVFSDEVELPDGPLLAVDADRDGDLDIFQTKAGAFPAVESTRYQPRWLLNDGSGRFTPAAADALPSLPVSVGAVAAADFEHSGELCIFVGARSVPGAYTDVPRSALLARRESRWVDITDEVAPRLAAQGMVTSALWSDVDGDGWIDLLVTYDWGPVVCYRNGGGKKLEDFSEQFGFTTGGTGWWRSIASADFNGDEQPDYIVGNVGLNTRYHASAKEPALLYAGVSLDGSAPQLVEAQAEAGQYFPVRTRETLVKVFPMLARRFPTAESYAKATLEDVFPGNSLSAAQKFSATEFRSGVFLSQPNRTFRFVAFPRLAQIAPISGIVAGDFDGDGRADVVVVGNSYTPIPEIGRFDGGLGWVLRGDGEGGFVPAPAEESGFLVRHDARGLAVVDLNQDGWPDCLVTRNNDRALAYTNSGVAGRHNFAVTLRGQPGNPAAVGARLTVTLADGTRQVSEVSAGSGYFSQSSATLFFGYPDAAPPKQLTIRWPDGHETGQSFDAAPGKNLRLSSP